MSCPKCGFNLFDRNTDGDDVCVGCGFVFYNYPPPQSIRPFVKPSRQVVMARAKEQRDKNGWGIKEFVENMGVSKTAAFRWLREWDGAVSV